MNQTARFFVSEFGGFTTSITEHGPILILKIARHKKAGGKRGRGNFDADKFFPFTLLPFWPFTLLPFEIGFPFLEKRAHPFVFVFA